jgi:hypothetical protein
VITRLPSIVQTCNGGVLGVALSSAEGGDQQVLHFIPAKRGMGDATARGANERVAGEAAPWSLAAVHKEIKLAMLPSRWPLCLRAHSSPPHVLPPIINFIVEYCYLYPSAFPCQPCRRHVVACTNIFGCRPRPSPGMSKHSLAAPHHDIIATRYS